MSGARMLSLVARTGSQTTQYALPVPPPDGKISTGEALAIIGSPNLPQMLPEASTDRPICVGMQYVRRAMFGDRGLSQEAQSLYKAQSQVAVKRLPRRGSDSGLRRTDS